MSDLTTTISMSPPPVLLEAFDRVSHQSGYADRSKALQAAMRAFISDFEAGVKKGNVVGSIVMVYDHETKGTDEAITETSHHHRQSILSSLHAHIDDAHSLCALLLRGKVPDIATFESKLTRKKANMQAK